MAVDESVEHEGKETGELDLMQSWDCSQIENEEEEESWQEGDQMAEQWEEEKNWKESSRKLEPQHYPRVSLKCSEQNHHVLIFSTHHCLEVHP